MCGRLATVMLAALLSACDETRAVSEGGRFELRFAGLRSEAWVEWTAPYRVLPGTRLCPAVSCAACDADDSCAGVPVRASGAVHADGACFVADGPGVSEWQVGAPCDDPELPTDRVRIAVVAADEVVADALPWTDRAVAAAELPTQGGDFVVALPTVRRVIAGSQLRLDPRLVTRDDGHVVGWTDGAVQVARTGGRAPVVYPGDALELVVFADTRAAASFTAGGATWPIGQVVGVAEEDADELAIAVALAPGEGGATPIMARAAVHDSEGRALLGLPVTWSLPEGALALRVDGGLPGPDWVAIDDACLPPEGRGGPRTARIRAEAGDLAAELELQWTGVAGEKDPSWEAAERCGDGQGGCGCRSGTDAAGCFGLLALLGRRRRRSR